MKKKRQDNKLNRFELLFSGFSKMTHATRAYIDYELDANHGVYCVFKGLHYMSYSKKFSDQTKIDIISDCDYDSDFSFLNIFKDMTFDKNGNLCYEETDVLFSFREIKRSYEMVALRALASIGTNLEPYYWELWLRLKDGTILNPKETKEYFLLNGGVEAFIAKDPLRVELDNKDLNEVVS